MLKRSRAILSRFFLAALVGLTIVSVVSTMHRIHLRGPQYKWGIELGQPHLPFVISPTVGKMKIALHQLEENASTKRAIVLSR